MVSALGVVSVPWQLAQVPWPGAPVFPSGGLGLKLYIIAGTERIATIVEPNTAALRRFVVNWIAHLANISLLLVKSHTTFSCPL